MAGTWQKRCFSKQFMGLFGPHTLDSCQKRSTPHKCSPVSLSVPPLHDWVCVCARAFVCLPPMEGADIPLDSCRPPGQRGTTCLSRNRHHKHTHARSNTNCARHYHIRIYLCVGAFHHGLPNRMCDTHTHTQVSLRSGNTFSHFSFVPKSTFINGIKAP